MGLDRRRPGRHNLRTRSAVFDVMDTVVEASKVARMRDHAFFTATSVAASLVILLGFGRTYPPKLASPEPGFPAIVHLHAAVFTAWLLFFIGQVVLAMRGRIALHRKLGNFGVIAAFLMLFLGCATAVAVTRRGDAGIPGAMFESPSEFLLISLTAIVVFFILTLAGYVWRKDGETHKRLMLMATIGGLMPPGIARLPLANGHTAAVSAITILFLVAGPIYDKLIHRRIHRAYFVGIAVSLFASPPLVHAMTGTSLWRSVASSILR